MKPVFCPYCGSQAAFKDAFVVYRRMGLGMVYICPNQPCDARVGVHEGTDKPKGSLANAALRSMRSSIHALFDPLWRDTKEFDRTELYEAAAHVMGVKEFHIGEMREDSASAFLANSQELIEKIKLAAQRNRLHKLASGDANLLGVLRYLFVESHPTPRHVLAQVAYRGHTASFNAGIKAGLVKRFKKADTNKVYFALTPSGCSALGLPAR